MPLNGSATSSKPDTSPQATLTSGQLPMSKQATSEPMRNVISLPASADGRSHSGPPAGMTPDLFGLEVVPASHSQSPAPGRHSQTSATFGLRGFLLSRSARLQESLASRLRMQLDGAGSTLFSLTWKDAATPLGRPYCRLVASARLTSDSDFGSWPTPMAGTPAQNGNQEAGSTDSSRKTIRLIGALPSRSGVPTKNPVQLKPEHSRWLMGYAPEHLNCVPTETRSFLKSRQSSFVPRSDVSI